MRLNKFTGLDQISLNRFRKRAVIVFLFFFLVIESMSSQVIGLGISSHTSYLHSVVNERTNNIESSEASLYLKYEHSLDSKFSILVGYYRFKVSGHVPLPNAEYSFYGTSHGLTKVNVFSLGLNRRFNFFNDRLSVVSGVGGRVLLVKRLWADMQECNIDEYLNEGYSGCQSYKAHPGIKVQPYIQLSLEFELISQVKYFATIGYTKGFSKFMESKFDYSYKSKQYPKVYSYVDGTAYYIQLGMSLVLKHDDKGITIPDATIID